MNEYIGLDEFAPKNIEGEQNLAVVSQFNDGSAGDERTARKTQIVQQGAVPGNGSNCCVSDVFAAAEVDFLEVSKSVAGHSNENSMI